MKNRHRLAENVKRGGSDAFKAMKWDNIDDNGDRTSDDRITRDRMMGSPRRVDRDLSNLGYGLCSLLASGFSAWCHSMVALSDRPVLRCRRLPSTPDGRDRKAVPATTGVAAVTPVASVSRIGGVSEHSSLAASHAWSPAPLGLSASSGVVGDEFADTVDRLSGDRSTIQ